MNCSVAGPGPSVWSLHPLLTVPPGALVSHQSMLSKLSFHCALYQDTSLQLHLIAGSWLHSNAPFSRNVCFLYAEFIIITHTLLELPSAFMALQLHTKCQSALKAESRKIWIKIQKHQTWEVWMLHQPLHLWLMGGKKDDDFLATSKNQGLRCFSFLQIVAVTSCFRLLKIEMR